MSDTQAVIPLTCDHRGRGAILYFDPTDRQWICHGCLLRIRKLRIWAIVEKRRALLRPANRSEIIINNKEWEKRQGSDEKWYEMTSRK